MLPEIVICPHCSNSDKTMIERGQTTIKQDKIRVYYSCMVCSKDFVIDSERTR